MCSARSRRRRSAQTDSPAGSGPSRSRTGLIETELRKRLNGDQLPGLLPEGRAAKPTRRNILTAFQGLGLTHTPDGIRLDRLTTTQRRILKLLENPAPMARTRQVAVTNRGKRA
jgi:hypothetical protein